MPGEGRRGDLLIPRGFSLIFGESVIEERYRVSHE
jgi:hypothetical protein